MTTTFNHLGLLPELVSALEEQGITNPFPIQAITIPDGLARRDVCGKAKTGSGKTLAFGLPLLQRLHETDQAPPRHPRALVLVPTRELATQVGSVLRPLGQRVGRRVLTVYGGVAMDSQVGGLRKGVDAVVATPGRLIDLEERGECSVGEVSILVIDEADRMADMGFIPQVEWILRRVRGEHQTMLFSATLDSDVRYLIRNYLRDPVRHEVASPQPTVEEMEHRFLAVHQMDKARVAAAIARGGYKTLLFVRTKRGADRLATQLRREGVKAAAIHGDLRQGARERALADFTGGKLAALVATDVAARGLDIEAVNVVVHYDPPEDHKGYLHRSGRTARAGERGVVATLVLWDQRAEVERIQRRLGLRMPIVEVFSNDPRLGELAEWRPQEDAA
jgi:superfamily II DNA/RNA helicase